jgi:hypothetical protein
MLTIRDNVLPYIGGTIVKKKKAKPRKAIAKSKPKPEIFVRVPGRYNWSGMLYAKAHIRVKSGEYQYLEWRDGDRPRSIYLGKKRKT